MARGLAYFCLHDEENFTTIYWIILDLGYRAGSGRFHSDIRQISGTIRDSISNRPRAVVSYVEVGQTDTARYLTNAQGRFSIDKAPAGDFILIVSNVGFQTRGIQYPATMAGELGIVYLGEKIKELGEIVIEAPPIKVLQDTVEYRANAFPVRKDAVAEDVFKKLPGVEVDNQGNITAHGQQVTKIKVNRKDFFRRRSQDGLEEYPHRCHRQNPGHRRSKRPGQIFGIR